MSYNKFKPSVTAEIEEWDETTDAIVWLVEQKYHLSSPRLAIDELPQQAYGRRYFETLEKQSALLTGYTPEHSKETYRIHAELTYIPESDSESGDEIEVCKITVKKEVNYKYVPDAEYTIKGANREEFEFVTKPPATAK